MSKHINEELLNDMAEHRPILKNNKKYVPPPMWFHTQNGYGIPQNRYSISQNVHLFLLCVAPAGLNR